LKDFLVTSGRVNTTLFSDKHKIRPVKGLPFEKKVVSLARMNEKNTARKLMAQFLDERRLFLEGGTSSFHIYIYQSFPHQFLTVNTFSTIFLRQEIKTICVGKRGGGGHLPHTQGRGRWDIIWKVD